MPDYSVDEQQLLGWIDTLSNWGRWGDDDELGTLNNLSPELTKRALALVEDGLSVSCAAPLIFNEAAPDVPRPPVHFMVGAGGEADAIRARQALADETAAARIELGERETAVTERERLAGECEKSQGLRDKELIRREDHLRQAGVAGF